ncbi:MAG: maltose ABC transporter substrate-binding protein [Chloroflexota bacterium]|nr:maltose ABC transporter substrate-binding protein [Chloroflexota bacterium]
MSRRTRLIGLMVLLVATMLLAACPAAEPTTAPEVEQPAAPVVEEPTNTPVPEPEPEPEPEKAEPTEAPVEEPAAASAQLSIWADKERMAALEPLKEKALNDLGVELVLSEVGFGDIRDKVKLAGPAGEGPDIFIGAHDWLGELYLNDLVAPINLGAKADQFFGPAIDGFTYNGELVGMPYATENPAFVYNPELVEKAPETWDEVIEMAAALEEAGTVKQGYVLFPNDAYHFQPNLTSYGGYIFGTDDQGSYDPSDVGLDSEGAIAALTWADEAVKAGHLSPDVDWEAAHVLFETGDAAMITTGPWALPRFREAGIPYAIVPLPGAAENASPFLGTQGFMVNNFSDNKLIAEAFLTEFIATPEVMQQIFDEDPRPPAFLPVRDVVEDADIAAFAAAGEHAQPMPAIPEMGSVWGAWGDAITLVFQGAATPEEAAATAAQQVRDAIAGN